jgi:predicted RNase H-like HicB family nuclease
MVRKFSALITQEGPHFIAQCLDVDVVSDGPSPDEALANLREALELYFEDAPAALAKAPCVRTVDVDVPASVQTGS